MTNRCLLRVPSLALLALLGCGEHAPFTIPVPSTDLVSQAPPSSGSPASPVGPPDHVDSPWLWRTAEGNLLVIDRSTAVLFDGSHWARHAAPAETEITLEGGSGSAQQLLVEGSRRGYTWRYDELTVLSTVDLATLHHGPGRVVDGAIAVPSAGARKATGQDPIDDASVLFVHEGEMVSLALPPGGGKKEVGDLHVDPKSDLAIVSWHEGSRSLAAAYSIRSVGLLGPAVTLEEPGGMPVAATVGRLQYYVAIAPPPARPAARTNGSSSDFSGVPAPSAPSGGVEPVPALEYDDLQKRRSLVIRDLETGRVLRQRPIACAGFLGNPTVSPNRDTVVVTCEGTALVLDGRTLTERRRIPYVIPGCDNAYALSGTIVGDAPQLLEVEGCGGFARLNLSTGRYLCGDSDGVMGGAYEAMDPDGSSRPGRPRPQAPPCSDPQAVTGDHVKLSALYTLAVERNAVLRKGAPEIQLEPDASMPVVVGNEQWLAYLHDKKLLIRTLPSGALLPPP